MPGKKRRGSNRRRYKRVAHDSYEWRVWLTMHERFPEQICNRWRVTDGAFAMFVQDMGGYGARPRDTLLARVDRTAPFSAENCYWKNRKAM